MSSEPQRRPEQAAPASSSQPKSRRANLSRKFPCLLDVCESHHACTSFICSGPPCLIPDAADAFISQYLCKETVGGRELWSARWRAGYNRILPGSACGSAPQESCQSSEKTLLQQPHGSSFRDNSGNHWFLFPRSLMKLQPEAPGLAQKQYAPRTMMPLPKETLRCRPQSGGFLAACAWPRPAGHRPQHPHSRSLHMSRGMDPAGREHLYAAFLRLRFPEVSDKACMTVRQQWRSAKGKCRSQCFPASTGLCEAWLTRSSVDAGGTSNRLLQTVSPPTVICQQAAALATFGVSTVADLRLLSEAHLRSEVLHDRSLEIASAALARQARQHKGPKDPSCIQEAKAGACADATGHAKCHG